MVELDTRRRRTNRRALMSLPVRFGGPDGHVATEGVCRDLSVGGMFVVTALPRAPGELVEVCVGGQDGDARAVGRVVWRRDRADFARRPAGMGVKFLRLHPGTAEVFERLLEAHPEDDPSAGRITLEGTGRGALQDSPEPVAATSMGGNTMQGIGRAVSNRPTLREVTARIRDSWRPGRTGTMRGMPAVDPSNGTVRVHVVRRLLGGSGATPGEAREPDAPAAAAAVVDGEVEASVVGAALAAGTATPRTEVVDASVSRPAWVGDATADDPGGVSPARDPESLLERDPSWRHRRLMELIQAQGTAPIATRAPAAALELAQEARPDADVPPPPTQDRARGGGLALVGLALLGLAVGAAGYWYVMGGAATASGREPVVAPETSQAVEPPAVSASPAPSEAPAPGVAVAEAVSARYVLHVVTEPTDAVASVEGLELRTPVEVELQAEPSDLPVEVRKPGYVPVLRQIDADGFTAVDDRMQLVLRLKLEPEPDLTLLPRGQKAP